MKTILETCWESFPTVPWEALHVFTGSAGAFS